MINLTYRIERYASEGLCPISISSTRWKQITFFRSILSFQILTDKRHLLETVLNATQVVKRKLWWQCVVIIEKVRVLLYTGNSDLMIHALGMNRYFIQKIEPIIVFIFIFWC